MDITEVLRQMEWEKLKGSIQALLCTYYGEDGDNKYFIMDKYITEFINKVEDAGLNL